MELTPEQGYNITGEWINKYTGQKVIVRDYIISEDNMIVLTNMGEINVNDFSNEYIQMSDEMYDQNGNKLSSEQAKSIENKNKEIIEKNNKIEFNQEFPKELLEKAKQQNKSSEIKLEVPKQEKQHTNGKLHKEELIKPIFDKIELNPQIDFSIKCENFPVEQFNMLKEYFDVSEKDIANYIINYIISDEDFIGAVEDFVHSKLK